MPPVPSSYTLSSSQNIPYNYGLDILSMIEPLLNEFLEEEVDNCKKSYVSEFTC